MLKNKLEKIKANKWIFILFGLIFVLRGIYFFFLKVYLTADSFEYIARDGFAWVFGTLDRYRLPVYPMLLDAFQFLFGKHYLRILCCFQFAISMISIVVLYKTLKCISPKTVVANWILVFLYSFSPPIFGWDGIILTESLSLSLTIFIVYGLVKFLASNELKYAGMAILFSGIGTFLRAVFAIYAGIILCFFFIRLVFPGWGLTREEKRSQRKLDVKGVLLSAIPIVLILGYAATFHAQFGGFTLSDSGLGQQITVILQNDFYQNTSDEELIQVSKDILYGKTQGDIAQSIKSIESAIKSENKAYEAGSGEDFFQGMFENEQMLDPKYEDALNECFDALFDAKFRVENFPPRCRARYYLAEHYDRDRLVRFVNEAKRNNLLPYLKTCVGNLFCNFSGYEIYRYPLLARAYSRIFPVFTFSLMFCFIAGCVELLMALYCILKKRDCYYHLGFSTLVISTALLSAFGTNGEFGRTAITVYPVIFVILSLWIKNLIGIAEKICKNIKPVRE